MRITVLANQDIASNLAINYLLRALPDDQLTVFLSSHVGSVKSRPPALQQLKFFEQTLFNELLFPALGEQYSTTDKQLLSFQEMQRAGIAVRSINSINDKEGLDQLAINKPHLLLSIRFGLILRQNAIAIPEFGVLNLHSGVLPDYRGVMATFWAMLHGEREIGTTLHYITDAGIDTGDIISVQTQAVDYQRCYLSNVLSLYEDGVKAMVTAVENIRQGQLPKSCKQQKNAGNYFSFPEDEALAAFHDKGLHLINHTEIVDFARKYFDASD